MQLEFFKNMTMIPIFNPYLKGNEEKYLIDCIRSEWISARGPFVTKFESSFAEYIGSDYSIAASNCTTALHLALKSLGIGPGDEVICPALTFISPIHMVTLSGASPVLVDIEEDSWNLSPAKIKEAITERTKAILVVHSFGHAARMDEISDIAREKGLFIIEDVAEALGGTFQGKMLGSFGDISCFSFFANKMLTCGEGGMALTKQKPLFEKMASLREYGRSTDEKYLYDDLGYNYRMTNMQAAIGCAQLEKFEEILQIRETQYDNYVNFLGDSPHFMIRPRLDWGGSIHWFMTVKISKPGIRDELMRNLLAKDIELRKMIYPVYHSSPYASLGNSSSFPVTEEVSLNSVHLPSSTELSEAEVAHVAKEFVSELTTLSE